MHWLSRASSHYSDKLLAQMTVALYACRDSYCDLPCSHNTPVTKDDGRQPCKTPTNCCHLACFDSSRRSQDEGTTQTDPWRRQAAWRFDIAAMELWAQRHLRPQWSTLWETLTCSRVPSPVPVPLRLQLSEKETSTAKLAAPTTFFWWHWKHLERRGSAESRLKITTADCAETSTYSSNR